MLFNQHIGFLDSVVGGVCVELSQFGGVYLSGRVTRISITGSHALLY